MALLGQHNSNPTHAHLLAAKGVLQYLTGTLKYSLEYGLDTSVTSLPIQETVKGCVLTNANWATDEKNQKSISGYCFYFLNSLVSWSAIKQKTMALSWVSSMEFKYYVMTHLMKEAPLASPILKATWPSHSTAFVEIKSASLDYLCDQNKKGNKILVVAVSNRGKWIANFSTCSHIYTVDYKIKGDRSKMLRKTIEVGLFLKIMYQVHWACMHSSQNSNSLPPFFVTIKVLSHSYSWNQFLCTQNTSTFDITLFKNMFLMVHFLQYGTLQKTWLLISSLASLYLSLLSPNIVFPLVSFPHDSTPDGGGVIVPFHSTIYFSLSVTCLLTPYI